jgi:diguanylate cyclase (GGDEF)-like protein
LPREIGGDEFALLLPDTGNDSAATAIARIVSELNAAMAAGGWPITFSVGAATFDVPHGSLDEMLRIVDALMYEVKGSGKAGIKLTTIQDSAVTLPT